MSAAERCARDGDDIVALWLAGFDYRNGDASGAVTWLQLAANRGYAEAQAGLGRAHMLGLGVQRSYSLAVKYCRLAADQDDSAGMNNLASLYQHGLGVPADPTQAAVLYRRAAMLGNIFAQAALGRLYESGRGVAVDYRLAYFWYCMAAARLTGGDMLIATKHRDEMAALLKPDVVVMLRKAARRAQCPAA